MAIKARQQRSRDREWEGTVYIVSKKNASLLDKVQANLKKAGVSMPLSDESKFQSSFKVLTTLNEVAANFTLKEFHPFSANKISFSI